MSCDMAKDYLNTYREYAEIERRKLEAYELEVEKIDRIPTAFNAPDGIPIPGNRNHSRTEENAIRLSERREAWQIAALNALEVRQEIFDVINSIDGIESDVLYERYINLRTWNAVSIAADVSLSGTHKAHRRGLEIVQERIDKLALSGNNTKGSQI